MISILTCVYAYNYGAVLQAYALQKKIIDCGHDCNIINYQPFYSHNRTDYGFLKNIVWKLYRLPDLIRGKKVFNSFVNTQLILTRKYTDNEDLLNNPPESDVFIVGSDQVWNFDLESGCDSSFVLNFVPPEKIKCSYAASIAMESLNDFQKEYLSRFLHDFKYISVRETTAKALIKSVGRNDVINVLDPVYLLSQNEWKSFAQLPETDEDYILFYAFNANNEIINYTYALKKRTRLKLYVIGTVFSDKKIIADRFFWNLSPEGFVGLFSKSKYVVTNSFHGISFSIIFNKPFKKFNKKSGNSRLDDLICELKINTNDLEKMDYSDSNILLREKVRKSLQFLEKIVMEDN